MFNSSILDVVIGLVFTFMAVSLATSAITEAVSSLLKLRQKTLLTGIKALVNDKAFTGLAKDLYNHALVNPLASGKAGTVADLTSMPAYVDAKQFAAATVGILERDGQNRPLRDSIEAVPDDQLRHGLLALLAQTDGTRAAFQAALGSWFDAAMDRLSGWYKRQTQAVSFAVALVICLVLNADALHVASALWQRPLLGPELSSTHVDPASDAKVLIASLEKSSLIGWDQRDELAAGKPWPIVSMLLGWLIVAGASLFGAPFWFDTLQRIAQLRGTGPSAAAAVKPPATQPSAQG